jgi:hypothetical protein
MNMKRTDYIILGSLLVIILLIGYLIASSRYEEPVAYEMRKTNEETTGTESLFMPSYETSYEASSAAEYANLGKRDIFRTIIMKPTPMPTREPTPVPPPNLERAIRTWKLEGAFGNRASFRDTRTNTEFTIDVGETRVISYRGRELEVKLSEINMDNFSATLTFGTQQIIKKMF